jgi:hypothetical protein
MTQSFTISGARFYPGGHASFFGLCVSPFANHLSTQTHKDPLVLVSEHLCPHPDVCLLFGSCPGTQVSKVHLVEAAHDHDSDGPVCGNHGPQLSVGKKSQTHSSD